LSQLLGELIGCLRALLVAKLDPAADGEGIPADLWTSLLQAAENYASDRILAAIDVFAESEGRMKWATNKRLHFELGVIKAIQTLGEVRITDVIKALAKGADQCGENFQPQSPPKAAASEPVKAAKPLPKVSSLDEIGLMIDAAPEESPPPTEPETPPWQETPKAESKAEPPPATEDPFYQDPLIQSALEKFEGKLVS
jgi:DNA polymerase-3 subunit gamma/tau